MPVCCCRCAEVLLQSKGEPQSCGARLLVGKLLNCRVDDLRVLGQVLAQLGLGGHLALALAVRLERVLLELRHEQLLCRLAQVDCLVLALPAQHRLV